MVKDTVFEFEKKRNEPLVYNRDLYVTTIAAIQRIGEVKRKREELFWENRYLFFYKRMKASKTKDV
jgi:large subunit ribosomal protein L24e